MNNEAVKITVYGRGGEALRETTLFELLGEACPADREGAEFMRVLAMDNAMVIDVEAPGSSFG